MSTLSVIFYLKALKKRSGLIVGVALKNMYFTVVCLPSQDCKFYGEVHSPFLQQSVEFCGLTELILIMDQVMKDYHLPKHDERYRHFQSHHAMIEQKLEYRKEDIQERFEEYLNKSMKCSKNSQNTFQIKVMYRQNYTWQGEIIWSEKHRTKFFRSALELMHLIYSVFE